MRYERLRLLDSKSAERARTCVVGACRRTATHAYELRNAAMYSPAFYLLCPVHAAKKQGAIAEHALATILRA